ncbi:MAG: hypothetical protein JNM56_13305 [Planctomycetia bacterium]|nr:hypothetical protein [Planctomycetia bacterium]
MTPYSTVLATVPLFLHRRVRRLLGDPQARDPRLIAPDRELLQLHPPEPPRGPNSLRRFEESLPKAGHEEG